MKERERVNDGQIKEKRGWVVRGPMEATDHSNYPLFSSNKAEALWDVPLEQNSLLIFSGIQFVSILCLLHIKHFLQLFLCRSYLYYLTPWTIQSHCSFHHPLVWLESIPAQDRRGWLWVCICVPFGIAVWINNEILIIICFIFVPVIIWNLFAGHHHVYDLLLTHYFLLSSFSSLGLSLLDYLLTSREFSFNFMKLHSVSILLAFNSKYNLEI